MPANNSADSPDDGFLITSMLGGDSAALSKLMDRYDRLVRYTVLRSSRERCAQDPQWLESVASATWAGFVRSMQRDPERHPKSLRAYLVQIARNQVISALRSDRHNEAFVSLESNDDRLFVAARLEEPVETLSRLELLEALRVCLAELEPDDRTMASQLQTITERRWKEAADALGMSESTLRSRWQRTLERLRACVKRKMTAESFAQGGLGSDL